ncbi:hypothetical protein M432DRAFT_670387 [Thermoascus aurantiacus ATCC 26904]
MVHIHVYYMKYIFLKKSEKSPQASHSNLVAYDDSETPTPTTSPTPTCWPRGLLRRGRLLERRGITYAVHGRLCAAAAGAAARHARTHDVDVAFQAPGRMRELWGGGGGGGGEDVYVYTCLIHSTYSLMLTIPHTSLISGIMRVFVRTGPQYSDDCDLPINVEVDLIESDSGNNPLPSRRRSRRVLPRQLPHQQLRARTERDLHPQHPRPPPQQKLLRVSHGPPARQGKATEGEGGRRDVRFPAGGSGLDPGGGRIDGWMDGHIPTSNL